MTDTSSEQAVSPCANKRVEVLLVCSGGGHLIQLHSLRDAWSGLSHSWVIGAGKKSYVFSLLKGEDVVFARVPTYRNVKNLVRNTLLAWKVLARARPAVIVTTGAAVAIPFAWLGRLRGARVVYVESLTRIDKPSLSCRLIRPVADRIYVQWPDLLKALPNARYEGGIFSIR